MALHSPRPEPSSAVSWWVRVLAHARLIGADDPEPPKLIRFDSTTPTAHHADRQASAIASLAALKLEAEGWELVDFDGWDIRAWSGGYGGEALVEFKTGPIGTAWLQLGQRLDNQPAHDVVPYAIVLHVARTKPGTDPKSYCETRAAHRVLKVWRDWEKRISDLEAGAVPTRSPGPHCGRCMDLNCAVRAESL